MSFRDAVLGRASAHGGTASAIVQQMLCPFDVTTATRISDGVTLCETCVVKSYSSRSVPIVATVPGQPFWQPAGLASGCALLRVKNGASGSTVPYGTADSVQQVWPIALSTLGSDVGPTPSTWLPQFSQDFPSPASQVFDQHEPVPYSTVDIPLAAGIQLKVTGLPSSTFMLSGTFRFVQLEAKEVDDFYNNAANVNTANLAAYIVAGKGYTCTAEEVFRSSNGARAVYLPRGTGSFVFTETGSALAQYGGGYGPGGSVNSTSSATSFNLSSGLFTEATVTTGAVPPFGVPATPVVQAGVPAGGLLGILNTVSEALSYQQGHLPQTGTMAAFPTLAVQWDGLPNAASVQIEFVNHTQYVPSAAVSGLLSPLLARPSPEGTLVAVTKLANAAKIIGGSTSLAPVKAVESSLTRVDLPATVARSSFNPFAIQRNPFRDGLSRVVDWGMEHPDKVFSAAESMGQLLGRMW